jgi:PPOX class probable FMN-dependent enzyme
MTANLHELGTVEAVRSIIGEPSPAVPLKVMDALDETAIAFIQRAPFLVLATADADGLPDVSPKGDEPGFVAVESPKTLLIPDRKGNRLIFSLQNILANPRIAALFMVPGTEETLRVQGHAVLTSDPDVLQRLVARGQPALVAARVTIERCYFHCAKAFRRSRLWQPDSWPARQRVSFGKQIAPRLGGGEELAKQIDEMVEADYKENL